MTDFDIPEDLQVRGRRLWESATAENEFSGAEFELLVEACRVADVLEVLAGDMDKLVEARHQRALLRQLVVTLGLQLDDDGQSKTQWGTSMAQRRWHGKRGNTSE